MTTETREFAARRERIMLRNALREDHGRQSIGAPPHEATDIDLGNYAAVASGSALWVSATPLVSGAPRPGALGAALAFMSRAAATDASSLVVVDTTDDVRAGITSRQAAYFDIPISVLGAHGTNGAHGTRGAHGPVSPAAHAAVVAPRREHLECAGAFVAPGIDIVVEHGVVALEVAGLEVARVVEDDGGITLSIGVGVHDRETFRMLHGNTATREQMREVAGIVARHRQSGAPSHPLNLLAPERAMRSRAVAEPQSIGMKSLTVTEPPMARTNVKDSLPCCALGLDTNDIPTIAVFVAGVDLDAVPFAADARDRSLPGARLVIVAPQRNIVPLQQRLAGRLREPARFVSA